MDNSIDLSVLDPDSSSFDVLSLDKGKHDISISLEDVMHITDEDNTLRIEGDKNDSVELTTDGDTEWTLGDFLTDSETGNSYQEVVGTDGDITVTLEISTNIDLSEG